MRVIFIGASRLAVMAARLLSERGQQVVIIERDKTLIDELSDQLDCGFLHGDGSKPAILRELGPKESDILFCLTGNDQANIIASLIGRSLGFQRTVTKIEDPEFEHICIELGLSDTIIPTRTIARYLADMLSGQDILELSSMVKGEARFFAFAAREEDEGPVGELGLPGDSRVVCLYRAERLTMADPATRIKKGDEVVLITRREHMAALRERWSPTPAGGNSGNPLTPAGPA
jgi:trk system potassium uptake protein TrkA